MHAPDIPKILYEHVGQIQGVWRQAVRQEEFLPFSVSVYLYTHVLLCRLIYFYRSSLYLLCQIHVFAKPYGGGGSVENFDLYQDIAMRTQGDI